MVNEIIFSLGVGITACSLIGAVIYFIFSQVKLSRLKGMLDAEYGKEEVFEKSKKDKKKTGK